MCFPNFDTIDTDLDANQDLACHRFRDHRERISQIRLDFFRSFNGAYIWGDRLGNGGFGSVSIAWKLYSPNQVVAIKQLNKEQRGNEGDSRFYERLLWHKAKLLNEAKVMQQLHHPNIIRLHEFWEEPGDPSKRHASPDLAVGDIGIVLDLYSGDLEGLLENRALISNLQQSDLIRDVAKQVFQALEYCHWRDIVHRDIKPGNILWKYNSELSEFHFALADFSLAEADHNNINPCYQAQPYFWWPPEFYRFPHRCTPAGDVWMLGVTLLWLADEGGLRSRSYYQLQMSQIWRLVKAAAKSNRWRCWAKMFAKDFRQRLQIIEYHAITHHPELWPRLVGTVVPLPLDYGGTGARKDKFKPRRGCWHTAIRGLHGTLLPQAGFEGCGACEIAARNSGPVGRLSEAFERRVKARRMSNIQEEKLIRIALRRPDGWR